LYADGLVFVAARDRDRLLCLEAATGGLRWETPALQVLHLLGVHAGRLLITTPRDIRAVDVQTGACLWRQPDGAALASFGRGILAGDRVVWPTRAGLRILDIVTGEQVVEPQLLRHVLPGNLLLAETGLLVVTPERVLLYGEVRRRTGDEQP
jgi:outer membrane protein assembly factor BamB